MTPQRSRKLFIAMNVALAVGAFAALTIAQGIVSGVIAASGVVAGLAMSERARGRGHSFSSLVTGFGDERQRGLYRESGYRTSEIMIFLLVAWALISIALGSENPTILCVVGLYSLVWAANIAWVGYSARRELRADAVE